MSEINNTYGSFDKAFGETAIAAANEIASLKADLEASKTREQTLLASVDYWAKQWRVVEADLEAFFQDGTLNEGSPLDDYLIETFDIQTTEEVEVTVTAIWSGTVTVKRGSDISDLDTSDSLPYELSVELDGETFELRQDSVDTDY